MCNDASSVSSVNQCLYKSLCMVKCYSLSFSSPHRRRRRRRRRCRRRRVRSLVRVRGGEKERFTSSKENKSIRTRT